MEDVRVVLIGGTSHAGKSTVARLVADRLGFDCRSTDGLARHPGRPWRTAGWEVPGHVAEHYASLTVDELITSVLDHYAGLWPRIETLIATHAAGDGPGAGLVLEGSALWPATVAGLRHPRTAAVWLTADDAVLRARMHDASGYDTATEDERRLVDAFLARSVRFQDLLRETLATFGLNALEVGPSRPVPAAADAVLDAVLAPHAPNRPPAGSP
ncbi:hypothetical protein N566_24025 [Streptomycetaceae bacterium MP113-05]|nr:hypothetical protein N566_24025 [Streptomycetaceae bacterium MP113-05]